MQQQNRRSSLLEMAAEEHEGPTYQEIEQADLERRERAKSSLFWAVGVPFGGMAAILIAVALHLGIEDFLCVWVICAGLVYAILSPAVK